MASRSRGWRRWAGFLLGTYLVWVVALSMISWQTGLSFALLIGVPNIVQAFIVFAKLLWVPVVIGSAAAVVVLVSTLRLLRLGFVVAIIANATFFAVSLVSAEVYAQWRMSAQATAQHALCFERNSLAGSIAAFEIDIFRGLPGWVDFRWRSHGRAILPDGRALWSYKTMRFERTDKVWQARLPCEADWMKARGE